MDGIHISDEALADCARRAELRPNAEHLCGQFRRGFPNCSSAARSGRPPVRDLSWHLAPRPV
jgi:hypothetical protein